MTHTPAPLEAHLGYWLRYVSNHVSHAFAQRVEAQGVTVAEWVLLRALYDAKGINPSQLATKVGMTRGAVSKLIERLCLKKLVARTSSDDDRRYQTLTITVAGKRLVPILAQLADDNDREFFGDLTPGERSQLLAVFQAIVRRHEWKELPID